MIRKWDTEDTAPLLALWLDSTIHAHIVGVQQSVDRVGHHAHQ
ncbi:hypothetical protein ACLBO4_23220, partial [Klebsiella pneumoniae]